MIEKEVLKSGDLDVVGGLFGLKLIKSPYTSQGKAIDRTLVELYIEDDENYFYKTSFDSAWLPDLLMVAAKGVLKK